MFLRNNDIRAAKGKIPSWLIAERLSMHENSYYRLMRKELTENEKQKILSVINEIKQEMK